MMEQIKPSQADSKPFSVHQRMGIVITPLHRRKGCQKDEIAGPDRRASNSWEWHRHPQSFPITASKSPDREGTHGIKEEDKPKSRGKRKFDTLKFF